MTPQASDLGYRQISCGIHYVLNRISGMKSMMVGVEVEDGLGTSGKFH
jgi:hypothetical protein